MHFFFRVDASIAMGTGHVIRCLTLADELKKKGAKTTFITRLHPGHFVGTIRSQKHNVIILVKPDSSFQTGSDSVAHAEWLGVSQKQDAEDTIKAISNIKPDWLVVDHYGLDFRWHKLLRPHVNNIFVIDDLADRKLDCDMLLDQSYGRKKNDYQNLVDKECHLLLGPLYALLRPEFSDVRPLAIARRKGFDGVKRILVSMGGVDQDNVTFTVLKGLAKVESSIRFHIDVILGRLSPYLKEIKEIAKNHAFEVSVSTGVNDMSMRMLKADLAIGAGGSTCWESCCLGLPTMVTVNAANQKEICMKLANKGVVSLIGEGKKIAPQSLQEKVEHIIFSKDRWKNMSESSFSITDGLGVKRVGYEFDLLRSLDGKCIRLRPVTINDLDLLFYWQSNPKTRRFSHNSDIPTYQEHYVWLINKIRQHDSFIELILHGSQPAGVIRLDPIADGNETGYLISIYISPDKYKLRIGRAALDIISQYFPFNELRAEVHKGNIASHAMFKNSGYEKCGEERYVKRPGNKSKVTIN